MAGTMLAATALGGGAQIASSVDQRKAAKRAQRRQERANRIERARANVEKSLARRRAINDARRATAINTASAAAQGISTGSSALQGANAAINSDLGTSIASANRTFVSGQSAFDERQRAAFTTAGAQANSAIVNAGVGAINQFGSFLAPSPSINALSDR